MAKNTRSTTSSNAEAVEATDATTSVNVPSQSENETSHRLSTLENELSTLGNRFSSMLLSVVVMSVWIEFFCLIKFIIL